MMKTLIVKSASVFILRENRVKKLVGIVCTSLFQAYLAWKTAMNSMKCSNKLIEMKLELVDLSERHDT